MTTQKYTSEFRDFLAWEAISRDHIDVKTIYIDIAGGDHAAGIFLSQLIFWYLIPGKDGRSKLRVRKEGKMWVAKSRNEWYDEIRIRPRQFDRVSKILEDIGIIETKVFKFAGVPKTHTRIVIDKFLEVWAEYAEMGDEEEGLPRGVKSTSRNGEVHIHRPPINDLSKDKSNVAEDDKEPENIKTHNPDKHCVVCGGNDRYAVKLDKDIDPKQRCPWCFVLDGWTHVIGKRIPQRTGTDTSKKLRKSAYNRMKEDYFKENWLYALQRAKRMKHLMEDTTFLTVEYILRNSEKIRDILGYDGEGGKFDGFEKSNHPSSYSNLIQWEKARAAGIPESKVTQSGWSQY